MLKKRISCVVMALCLTASVAVFAKEVMNVPKWAEDFKEIVDNGSPDTMDWEKASKLGSHGNVYVFFDAKGSPEIYVIGKAAISSTLNSIDAEEDADEEAEFSAKESFALWMSEHFGVKNTRDKKVLTVRGGKKDDTGAISKTERSEDIVIRKKTAEQTAAASWRGMRKFTAKRTKDEYIVVWRWSLTEHRIAKLIENLTRDGDIGSEGRPIETFDWIKR